MSEENVQETQFNQEQPCDTSSTQTNEAEQYYHRRVILYNRHFIDEPYLRDHIACVRIQPQRSNKGRHDLHYDAGRGVCVQKDCSCNGISLFTDHEDKTDEFYDENSAEEYRRYLKEKRKLGVFHDLETEEKYATSICFKIRKRTLEPIVTLNNWEIGDDPNPKKPSHKLLKPLKGYHQINPGNIFCINSTKGLRLVHLGTDVMGNTSDATIWEYCSCVKKIVGGAENVVGAGNYDAFGDTVVRSLENLIEDPDLDPPTKRQYEEIFDELHELSLLTLQEIFSVKSHLMEKFIEILEDEGDVDLIENAKRMMNHQRPERFKLIKTVFNYCYPIVLFVHYYDNDQEYGLTRNKEFTKTLLYKILKYIRESLSRATLDTSMGIFICVAKNLLLIYRTFGMDLAEMKRFEKFVKDDDHFTYKDETGATFYCTTNDVMTEIEKWHLFRTYHIMLGNFISRLGQEIKRSRSDYYPFTWCESFDWKSALHNIDEPPEFKNGCKATDKFGVKVLHLIKNVDKKQFSKEFDLSFVFTKLSECKNLNVEYWRTVECQTRQFIMRLVEINVYTSGDRLLGTYFTPEDSGNASCPDKDVHKCFIEESRKMLKIGEDISLIVKPVGSANIVQLFVGNGQVETIFNFQAPEQVSFNISDNIRLQYNKIDERTFLQNVEKFLPEAHFQQIDGQLPSSKVWNTYERYKRKVSQNESSEHKKQKTVFHYSPPILILFQQCQVFKKSFKTFERTKVYETMTSIRDEVWNAMESSETQKWTSIADRIFQFYLAFNYNLSVRTGFGSILSEHEPKLEINELDDMLKTIFKYHLYHLLPKNLGRKPSKLELQDLDQFSGTVEDWVRNKVDNRG